MTEKPIKLYRPTSAIAGESFYANWCYQCARDKAMREGCDIDECDDNEKCSIIGDTMAYIIDDANYPKEWRYNENGEPICTAFVQAGEPIPLKDDLTMDLFE